MKILDLCCREQTIRKAAERVFGENNVAYTGIDINPANSPTVCASILEWDPPHDVAYDIVWASPPLTSCTHEEAARISKRCLALIDITKPSVFFIENLATGTLNSTDLKAVEHHTTACYTVYGPPYKKVAHIWSNVDRWQPDEEKGYVCDSIAERMLYRAKTMITPNAASPPCLQD